MESREHGSPAEERDVSLRKVQIARGDVSESRRDSFISESFFITPALGPDNYSDQHIYSFVINSHDSWSSNAGASEMEASEEDIDLSRCA